MTYFQSHSADPNPIMRRSKFGVHALWGAVVSFWQGLKLAKASVISVLFGFLLFYAVPQAQDLFLEVRGSVGAGSVYWIAFYFAILVGWAIPVYVSSRWVLSRFQRRPEDDPDWRPVIVAVWIRRRSRRY